MGRWKGGTGSKRSKGPYHDDAADNSSRGHDSARADQEQERVRRERRAYSYNAAPVEQQQHYSAPYGDYAASYGHPAPYYNAPYPKPADHHHAQSYNRYHLLDAAPEYWGTESHYRYQYADHYAGLASDAQRGQQHYGSATRSAASYRDKRNGESSHSGLDIGEQRTSNGHDSSNACYYRAGWGASPTFDYNRTGFEAGLRTHRPRAYKPSIHHDGSLSASSRPSSSRARSPVRHRSEHRTARLDTMVVRPRTYYQEQTCRPPSVFPVDGEEAPVQPLPLMVLDLNGTLVYRGKRSMDRSTSERSRQPDLRPYLSCFLQYCLGVKGAQDQDFDKQQDEWQAWDGMREGSNPADVMERLSLSPSPPTKRDRTHGSHFWPKADKEPTPEPSATYRLLLWSSAQPHNVNLMARAILSPTQAEQLLRVYARDTLVTQRLYNLKAPSIKDLEILWTSLNNAVGTADFARGEERLRADARNRDRSPSSSGTPLAEDLRALWEDGVSLPQKKLQDGAEHFVGGRGYGPHNTLLLDDSSDKAAMQPHNHILIPEYDGARARAVKRSLRSRSVSVSSQNGDKDELGARSPQDEAEDVLLQTVGVLEHARYHANVASWIRFGGLGDFGGMAAERSVVDGTTARSDDDDDDDDPVKTGKDVDAEKTALAWKKHFSLPCPTSAPQHDEAESTTKVSPPRLTARVEDRTPAFWAAEGRSALLRKGIIPRMF